MHIVFLGYEGEFEFGDSIIGMFVMSLGEFGDIYDTYDETRYPNMAKVKYCIVCWYTVDTFCLFSLSFFFFDLKRRYAHKIKVPSVSKNKKNKKKNNGVTNAQYFKSVY